MLFFLHPLLPLGGPAWTLWGGGVAHFPLQLEPYGWFLPQPPTLNPMWGFCTPPQFEPYLGFCTPSPQAWTLWGVSASPPQFEPYGVFLHPPKLEPYGGFMHPPQFEPYGGFCTPFPPSLNPMGGFLHPPPSLRMRGWMNEPIWPVVETFLEFFCRDNMATQTRAQCQLSHLVRPIISQDQEEGEGERVVANFKWRYHSIYAIALYLVISKFDNTKNKEIIISYYYGWWYILENVEENLPFFSRFGRLLEEKKLKIFKRMGFIHLGFVTHGLHPKLMKDFMW